jgi:PTH2 family peptidyl-tRNA hydrolase
MDVRQIIVIRTDLNMRKGKMVSQGGHSILKVFFDRITSIIPSTTFPGKYQIVMDGISPEEVFWVKGSFTKVCVGVPSEEALKEVYEKAKAAGLPCSIIEDNGKTEFHDVKTFTACSIGPCTKEESFPITGHLPLL